MYKGLSLIVSRLILCPRDETNAQHEELPGGCDSGRVVSFCSPGKAKAESGSVHSLTTEA